MVDSAIVRGGDLSKRVQRGKNEVAQKNSVRAVTSNILNFCAAQVYEGGTGQVAGLRYVSPPVKTACHKGFPTNLCRYNTGSTRM